MASSGGTTTDSFVLLEGHLSEVFRYVCFLCLGVVVGLFFGVGAELSPAAHGLLQAGGMTARELAIVVFFIGALIAGMVAWVAPTLSE